MYKKNENIYMYDFYLIFLFKDIVLCFMLGFKFGKIDLEICVLIMGILSF